MFSVGDYVVYGSNGVCRVELIGPMQLSGAPKDKLYYTLAPVYMKESRIYTPVDNQKVKIRAVLTEEESKALIQEIPSIQLLWLPDERKREDIYKEAIATCDSREWIRIIKTLYIRKQSRLQEGKKVTVSDERYLKRAEEYLYEELAVSLHLDKDKVQGYITEQVEKGME